MIDWFCLALWSRRGIIYPKRVCISKMYKLEVPRKQVCCQTKYHFFLPHLEIQVKYVC